MKKLLIALLIAISAISASAELELAHIIKCGEHAVFEKYWHREHLAMQEIGFAKTIVFARLIHKGVIPNSIYDKKVAIAKNNLKHKGYSNENIEIAIQPITEQIALEISFNIKAKTYDKLVRIYASDIADELKLLKVEWLFKYFIEN